jgi:phage terminase large subunit
VLAPNPNVWPPDYVAKYEERDKMCAYVKATGAPAAAAFWKRYSRGLEGCIEWIEDWVDTYDPRNAGKLDKLATMPLIMFPRQRELVDFLFTMIAAETNGLIEKSRDMGATWVAAAVSVWFLIYRPGASIGWGSRKADLVDRIGEMDSIFEKMRFIIKSLPTFLRPPEFDLDAHMSYMKIINPASQASISGESGDDIGRGGRKLFYLKDESAHYVHAEAIEASLSENTRVQIDISSVNGPGNVFHQAREGGALWEPGDTPRRDCVNIFVMDWRDHPEKTQTWYKERESLYKSKGLIHVFRQEVDRNYFASLSGHVIEFEWVLSAIDADKKLGIRMDEGGYQGALDVADGEEGIADANAFVKRKGVKLYFANAWSERDTGLTTRRAILGIGSDLPMTVQYDCIGVGSGVKSEINRLEIDDKTMPKGVRFIPWDAGQPPLWPDKRLIDGDRDSPLNVDFYKNLKAQGWWLLRIRFENTHRAITEGIKYPVDEMICIDGNTPLLDQIKKELAQPTKGLSTDLKLLINKTPKGTRSPNLGDATMMCFHPAISYMYDSSMSWVG